MARRLTLIPASVLAVAVALSACSVSAPTRTPSVQTSASALPSPSAIPADHDLLSPGLAQQVVAELVAAADGKPVVRVVISRTQARLTYIDDGDRPRSMVWIAGIITPSDDGTDLVAATSFNPNTFNLSNIAELFSVAALLSGSVERQELQINEYDHKQVLMTVTTSPESSTVFFDRNGDLIPRLDFSLEENLAAGLESVYGTRMLIQEAGVTIDSANPMGTGNQVWADVVTVPGVVERRIRTATVPMFQTQRREAPTNQPFDRSLIDPAVINELIRTAPEQLEQPDATTVTVRVNQPATADEPRITVEAGGAKLVTDLAGTKIDNP